MADDMQYSFAYTHYLLEKRDEITAMDIFAMTDGDSSDDLDMYEVKELLLKLHLESNLRSSTNMLNLLVQEFNSCKSETQTFLDVLLLPFRWRMSKKQFFSCPKILEFLKHIRGKKNLKPQ
eukprot:TRINITY_DN32808_c0_g1_i1.p1 TRINITY_DN32808_c0_g1~~TRINITY_DN32808_c0_g1_i1.p1  ORF type:complete len:121 (-),score=21.72 TRINITY_DN32808_c0_g1_i1:158-520(-)